MASARGSVSCAYDASSRMVSEMEEILGFSVSSMMAMVKVEPRNVSASSGKEWAMGVVSV